MIPSSVRAAHRDILDDFTRKAAAALIPTTDKFNTGDNAGVGCFKVSQRGVCWPIPGSVAVSPHPQ
ncbi:hypothetical protein [Paracoccus lutimaris]|uniref:hypothetical protein n=1 Tax=Paracoccus lutimaris TaxID=1490030 RepID=UPI0011C039E7|nr:hypothetical protein [Paracoccus lutimaris]